MATKPLVDTSWATQLTTDGPSGNLNKQEPSTAFKNFGQPESQPIDRQSMNYELDALDQWKNYFEVLTDEFLQGATTTRFGLVKEATLQQVVDGDDGFYPDASTVNIYVNNTVSAFNTDLLQRISDLSDRVDYEVISGGGVLVKNKRYIISDNATYTLPSVTTGVQGDYLKVLKTGNVNPTINVNGGSGEQIDYRSPITGQIIDTDTGVLFNIFSELTFVFKSPNWEL